ncbi:MAG: Ig-like domain-containing protein [Bacteroidales bacterium]|nr:Ig-like domain-containing protein [Bacteroidales bacterium]
MKKQIITIMAAAIAASLFASCNNDEEDNIVIDRENNKIIVDTVHFVNNTYNDNIVVVSKETISMNIGEETECVARVFSSQTPTYKSGDDKIATVSKDGKVKGIAEGETIIYISIQGNDMAKINVKVMPN